MVAGSRKQIPVPSHDHGNNPDRDGASLLDSSMQSTTSVLADISNLELLSGSQAPNIES